MPSEFRSAKEHEMDEIYLMGYDAWSDGSPVADYLAGCRKSKKYRNGRWFVLCAEGRLCASLLVHDFEPWGKRPVRGIGSIATDPKVRRQGYGRLIVKLAVRELVERENASVILLYSDIGAQFYERERFHTVAPEFQSAQGSTLMVRMLPEFSPATIAAFRNKIPGYF